MIPLGRALTPKIDPGARTAALGGWPDARVSGALALIRPPAWISPFRSRSSAPR
jgi:hypothetical protein